MNKNMEFIYKLPIPKDIKAQYMYAWVEDTGVREDDGKGNLTVLSSFIGFIAGTGIKTIASVLIMWQIIVYIS